jgi:hypothetical protein
MPANRSKTISNIIGMQGMLYRTLGSTGEKVSAIGIGGWHNGLNEVVGACRDAMGIAARPSANRRVVSSSFAHRAHTRRPLQCPPRIFQAVRSPGTL